jgi:hypothetical protein
MQVNDTAEYAEGYATAWDAATERAIGEIDSKEYASGYDRGERVASARAESRRRLGLPIRPAGLPRVLAEVSALMTKVEAGTMTRHEFFISAWGMTPEQAAEYEAKIDAEANQ